LIWVSDEGKYFCEWDWTADSLNCSLICPSGNQQTAVIARLDRATSIPEPVVIEP
jgi:hypothetical protein